MARGRKKDPTIMAGRALTLQRDYRARKAQYVADLEERCAAAEAENVRLREEIVFLRGQSGPPATLSPAVVSPCFKYFCYRYGLDVRYLFCIDPSVRTAAGYARRCFLFAGVFHAGCAACGEQT
jgi:hypothetical protein